MKRELLSADVIVHDDRVYLRLMCDCGTVTDADVTQPSAAGVEFAVTCDGCLTATWVTPVAGVA